MLWVIVLHVLKYGDEHLLLDGANPALYLLHEKQRLHTFHVHLTKDDVRHLSLAYMFLFTGCLNLRHASMALIDSNQSRNRKIA